MAILSKNQILECSDKQYKTLHIPEWNGDITIASFSGESRLLFEQLAQQKDDRYLSAKLVMASIVDENDNLLFTEDDIPALAKKSWPVLERIVQEIVILNKLGPSIIEAEAKN